MAKQILRLPDGVEGAAHPFTFAARLGATSIVGAALVGLGRRITRPSFSATSVEDLRRPTCRPRPCIPRLLGIASRASALSRAPGLGDIPSTNTARRVTTATTKTLEVFASTQIKRPNVAVGALVIARQAAARTNAVARRSALSIAVTTCRRSPSPSHLSSLPNTKVRDVVRLTFGHASEDGRAMTTQTAPRPALAISNDVVVKGGATPLLPLGHAVLAETSRNGRRPLATKVNDAAHRFVSRVGLPRPSTDPNVDSRTWHNAVVMWLTTHDAHTEMATQAHVVVSEVNGLYTIGTAEGTQPLSGAHAYKSIGPTCRQIATIRPSSIRGAICKPLTRLSN